MHGEALQMSQSQYAGVKKETIDLLRTHLDSRDCKPQAPDLAMGAEDRGRNERKKQAVGDSPELLLISRLFHTCTSFQKGAGEPVHRRGVRLWASQGFPGARGLAQWKGKATRAHRIAHPPACSEEMWHESETVPQLARCGPLFVGEKGHAGQAVEDHLGPHSAHLLSQPQKVDVAIDSL
ncbi:hypothetical protein EWB00_000551 [Schistosoma japonicum]|uniref:Uncharacterized protein n=1 Tax=Schistosoma japonicum TaxID=6182 RepID=A0A4Z2CK70_SCHJA|nr:hypothetical protein EWB00_000551 [Schistosoma japonicum]